MAGLDKVKEQILSEARAVAVGKINDAESEAAQRLAEANDEAKKTGESIRQRSDEEVKKYNEKVVSSCDMQKRTRLLETKQDLINELFVKALDRVNNMETPVYTEFLLKVLENRLKPEEGVLYFSAKDLARLPADFSERASELAAAKGGGLIVSEKAMKIDNGFVITYGNIEENCTIEALFNDKKDDLRDMLHKLLFS